MQIFEYFDKKIAFWMKEKALLIIFNAVPVS